MVSRTRLREGCRKPGGTMADKIVISRHPIFMVAGSAEAAVSPSFATDDGLTAAPDNARLVAVRRPVVLNNPDLAIQKVRFLPQLGIGVERGQVRVPISPVPEPVDTSLFEDPADAAKKLYLPRY